MSAETNDVRPEKRSLRRNIAFATLEKIIFAVCQFTSLWLVVRLGTTEDVGARTIAVALVTPLFFLASLGMREVHSVDDLHDYTRADYVVLRAGSGTLAVLLSVLLVFTYQSQSGWLVQSTTLAFATLRFFHTQSSLSQGIFQRAERLDYVAVAVFLRSVPGVMAFAVVFWYTRSLPLATLAEAVSWCLSMIIVDRHLLKRLNAASTWEDLISVRLAKIAWLAWWVLPMGVALWLTRAAASVPPLALEHYADLATVGVFGALAYFHTAFMTLSSGLGSASAARLRRHYRDGKRKAFQKLVLKLIALSGSMGTAAVLLAWFFGEPLLAFIYGEQYARGDLFVVVILASAIQVITSPLQTALLAGQAFRRRLSNSFFSFLISVAAALTLVPAFGITGAVWTLVITKAGLLLLALFSFRTVVARIAPPPAPPPGAEIGATQELAG